MALVLKAVNTITGASEIPSGVTLRYDNTVCHNPDVIVSTDQSSLHMEWTFHEPYTTDQNYLDISLDSSSSDVYFYLIKVEYTDTQNIPYVVYFRSLISSEPFTVSYRSKYRNLSEKSGTITYNTPDTDLANMGLTGVYGAIGLVPGDIPSAFKLGGISDYVSDVITTIPYTDVSNWYNNSLTVDPNIYSPSPNNRCIYFARTLAVYFMDTQGVDVNDPYDGIPDSDVDGGGGDFDNSSVPIDFPPLPDISITDSGMCSIYKPTLAELQALNAYLWEEPTSGGLDPDIYKTHMNNNIMECFIGLSVIPCIVPATNTKTFKIGGINTNFTYHVPDSQYVDVPMGTLNITTGNGNTYLDYSPYTKAQIYLPLIGFQDLNVDDIMNKTLKLNYRFDIVSGACIAFLKCGDSILYTFNGNCKMQIPLTGADYTQVVASTFSGIAHMTETIIGTSTAIGGAGTPIGMLGAGAVVNGVAGLASDVMGSKPTFTRSGSIAGSSGIMGVQYAYVILTRPSVLKPKRQYEVMGYPSFIFRNCSELTGKGFTSFSELKMNGVTLTQSEKEELAGILKGGVYL